MEKQTIDELARTQRVQDCQTIKELEDLFDEFKAIKGMTKEYDSEKLKLKIEQLRFLVNSLPFDKVPWNVITRKYGIRAKCMELFYYEKTEVGVHN